MIVITALYDEMFETKFSGFRVMASYNFKADEQLQSIILRNSETIRAATGTTLFREGEKVRGVFLLVSGKVPASINHHPYSLTAVVKDDAELRFISVQTLTELMKREPSLTMQLVTMLSEEVRAMRKVFAGPRVLAR